jgi:hypothetical protein
MAFWGTKKRFLGLVIRISWTFLTEYQGDSFVRPRHPTPTHFKWADKQSVTVADLAEVLDEVESGNFEADLGGHVLKKRIKLQGQGRKEAAGPSFAS